ncbi:osmoprotectant, partial [Mammaliicoccus sciuri]
LQDSVRTILKRNVRNVPVVDAENHIIGLITRANLVDIVYDSIWGDPEEDVTTSEQDIAPTQDATSDTGVERS